MAPVGSAVLGKGNSFISFLFFEIFHTISPFTSVRYPTCLALANFLLVLILANCFYNSFLGNMLPDSSVNASAGVSECSAQYLSTC